MHMIQYATPTELGVFIDPDADPPVIPPLATVLLRKASQLVLDAIAGLSYAVDAEGLPTKAEYLDAAKSATLEQASAWSVNGIDPRKGSAGLKPLVTLKSLGGAQVSYGQSAEIQAAIVALASGTSLTSAAWAILRNAGMISNRVDTRGTGGVEYFNVRQRYYDPLTGALDG